MKLLLDSHALLWWWQDDPALAAPARRAIAARSTEVWVSAATIWELAIKQALGKLEAPADLEAAVADEGFKGLPVTLGHAQQAARLPRHHADPFDRLLVAQATAQGLTLVSRDARLAAYGVALLPA